MDELVRILEARPQQFRVQFFRGANEHGGEIVRESTFSAPDIAAAVRVAVGSSLPEGAIGLRLLDSDGREVFEQLKADRR